MADLGLYENLIEHARIMESINYRRQSVILRNMELAFEMPDREFVGLYRLNKHVCRDLIMELEPFLISPRRDGISLVSKVLSALNFYASGSYQRFVGASAHHTMHQVSVSNSMRAVTVALNNNHFRTKYICFPQTPQERNGVKQGFVTLITTLSIDASHGGANHDSFIWNHHPLKAHLERLHHDFNENVWFLGDSGYPLRPTLLTPILNTEADTPQRHYTDLHCRVRSTVERCIGVLKSRWRCLLVNRKLHYHPTTAGFITNACVVLHNMANIAGLPVEELTAQEMERERNMQVVNNYAPEPRRRNDLGGGEATRNALVQRLWAAAR